MLIRRISLPPRAFGVGGCLSGRFDVVASFRKFLFPFITSGWCSIFPFFEKAGLRAHAR